MLGKTLKAQHNLQGKPRVALAGGTTQFHGSLRAAVRPHQLTLYSQHLSLTPGSASVASHKRTCWFSTTVTRHGSHTGLASLAPKTVNAVTAAATVYPLPLFFLMLIFPFWHKTAQLAKSELIFLPLAAAYAILLCGSWQPDTLSLILPGTLSEGLSGGFKPQFFPSLGGISSLFSRTTTAASLWLHLVAINLFAACRTFLEGRELRLPTRHTTLLCMVFGPLGVLSSMLTKAFVAFRRGRGHGSPGSDVDMSL